MHNRSIWRLQREYYRLNASFDDCTVLKLFFELQLSFQIFLLQLNGINTQCEKIADNGGIKDAYRAYSKWTEEQGPELELPGLDYTQEQILWISAGQTYIYIYMYNT